MGAGASVKQVTSASKWELLQTNKQVLNKEALNVIEKINHELLLPIDGSDIPDGIRCHYHAINEVRRIRATILQLTRVPEKDPYVMNLKKEAAKRTALKRNPEKTQRTEKYNQLRIDQSKMIHTIQNTTNLSAVNHGMYAGGILRDIVCSTPRNEPVVKHSLQTTTSTTAAAAAAAAAAATNMNEKNAQNVVPYNIFIRRAVINLPSIPTKFTDGTKSKVNRVLKVAEVDQKANQTLIEAPPRRPQPNVVSVLITKSKDKDGQMLKGFPTLLLSSNPDVALKNVRYELKRQWGLDGHVLSYHTDPEQDTSETGWRLFEIECHDSSWVPSRLIPNNTNYRSLAPKERYNTIQNTRGQYDEFGHLEYINKDDMNQNEIIIPGHGADWMELDVAIGASGLEPLDVSPTTRDVVVRDWHELRDIKYARERSQEALLMPLYQSNQNRENILVKRAPWRQLGWYTFAVGWVDQQLGKTFFSIL
jgi:hypothetical protein